MTRGPEMLKGILHELRSHAPFTALGAITGIVIMTGIILGNVLIQVSSVSKVIFYILHPAHILLSAIATTAMYTQHRHRFRVPVAIAVGYVGSIAIATLSDSLIPYLGEWLLELPNRGTHVGFIEEPWLTNPAAFLGVAIALWRPTTRFPHFGHVLISTWASLFHIIMATGQSVSWLVVLAIFAFLFLAVWVPCCTSDIVVPLMLAPIQEHRAKRTG